MVSAIRASVRVQSLASSQRLPASTAVVVVVSTLRGQLTKTEKELTKARDRAERWKTEAKAQRRSASRVGARVEKLHQKLDRATAALAPVQATAPIESGGLGSTGGRANDRRRCHRARRDVERRPRSGEAGRVNRVRRRLERVASR